MGEATESGPWARLCEIMGRSNGLRACGDEVTVAVDMNGNDRRELFEILEMAVSVGTAAWLAAEAGET